MRQHCDELPHDHPTRQPWFLPEDPPWQNRDVVQRVRDALKKLDSRLNVWWVPKCHRDDAENPGRWGVVEWRRKARVHSLIYYHEGSAGEFRHLDDSCIDPMLNYLRSCEVEANVAAARVEEEQQKARAKARADVSRACAEEAQDMYQRAVGVRQTFGPGFIRSRRFVTGGWHSENHQRYLRSKGLIR